MQVAAVVILAKLWEMLLKSSLAMQWAVLVLTMPEKISQPVPDSPLRLRQEVRKMTAVKSLQCSVSSGAGLLLLLQGRGAPLLPPTNLDGECCVQYTKSNPKGSQDREKPKLDRDSFWTIPTVTTDNGSVSLSRCNYLELEGRNLVEI